MVKDLRALLQGGARIASTDGRSAVRDHYLVLEQQHLIGSAAWQGEALLRPCFRRALERVAAGGGETVRPDLPFVSFLGAAGWPTRPVLKLDRQAPDRAPSTFVDGNPRRDLDQLDATEELPDRFGGQETVLRHEPLVIASRHPIRIAVPGLADDRERDDDPLPWPAHLYVRIFPYGLVTSSLAIPVKAPKSWKARRTILLLRQLAGLARARSATYTMARRGGGPEPISGGPAEFADLVVAAVVGALFPEPEHAALRQGPPARTLVVSTDDPLEPGDPLAPALLMLEPRIGELDATQLGYGKLYGKYKADTVLASSTSTLICVSPRQFRSGAARRRFVWNLMSIMELARAQKLVFPALTEMLDPQAGVTGLWEAQDLIETIRFLDHLRTVHRGLDAHHRRWYYKCQEVLGLPTVMANYDEARRAWRDEQRAHELMRIAMQDRVTLNISGGVVQNLNLGTVVGNIEASLNVVSGPDAGEFRDAIKGLSEAIAADAELADADRRTMLQQLEALAAQGAEQPEERNQGIIAACVDSLKRGLAMAASAASAWKVFGPAIVSFLGL